MNHAGRQLANFPRLPLPCRAASTRVVLGLLLVAATAHAAPVRAEYKCGAPPGPLDRRACSAAQQGPEALRRFIQRVRPLEALYFFDYMSEPELLAWRARSSPHAPAVSDRSARATERKP